MVRSVHNGAKQDTMDFYCLLWKAGGHYGFEGTLLAALEGKSDLNGDVTNYCGLGQAPRHSGPLATILKGIEYHSDDYLQRVP
jgi:hypothetical protein